MTHQRTISLFIIAMMLATGASADDWDVHRPTGPKSAEGLSVFVNAGTLWADNNVADFYSGIPGNANTVERVLHSELYGRQIWEDLTNADLISSSISNYTMLTVDEYSHARYNLSFQFGLGFRYDYPSGFGWLARFDIVQLTVVGAFNLNSSTGGAVLEQRGRYVPCEISGRENRINIDFGLTKRIPLLENIDLDVNAGLNINNTKVLSHDMMIAGRTYSILDVWNGQSPSYGTQPYEYINQGGIGVGFFGTLALAYNFEGIGTVSLGYTCYRTKINLEGYAATGWQHNLFARFVINNFIFF